MFGMGTGDPLRYRHRYYFVKLCGALAPSKLHSVFKVRPSPRLISTGRLNVLPRLHLRPIHLVVCKESYSVNQMGDLILRLASRLDAFSAYPVQT